MANVKKTKGKKTGNLIIQQTIIRPNMRRQLEIDHWRSALRTAENVVNPNRTLLYDIYADIELDSHLSSVIEKRKAAILKKRISFVRDGEEDPLVMEQIRAPWFHRFRNDMLDSISWEHSLFQFYWKDKWIDYDLIPRKHVKPEKRIVVKNQNDFEGIPYKNNPEFPNILEVKFLQRFGLLLKAAPWIIYKRNGMGDFAQFAEIFGMPMREGIYDGYDDEARKKLLDDLTAAASSSIFVHPDGTKVNNIDVQNKAGSTGLFDKLIEICNVELSKLYLGNTLTTEQGDKGSRNLGVIHKEEEEALNIMDTQFEGDVLNYDLTEIFNNLGINTIGGEFIYETDDIIEIDKKIIIDEKVALKVPIDDDYWYNTYGIPKPDNYDELKAKQDADKLAMEQIRQNALINPKPDPNNPNPEANPPDGGPGKIRTLANSLRTFWKKFVNAFDSFFV